jgi:hypothetical protein
MVLRRSDGKRIPANCFRTGRINKVLRHSACCVQRDERFGTGRNGMGFRLNRAMAQAIGLWGRTGQRGAPTAMAEGLGACRDLEESKAPFNGRAASCDAARISTTQTERPGFKCLAVFLTGPNEAAASPSCAFAEERARADGFGRLRASAEPPARGWRPTRLQGRAPPCASPRWRSPRRSPRRGLSTPRHRPRAPPARRGPPT